LSPPRIHFLSQQYRMHPDICTYPASISHVTHTHAHTHTHTHTQSTTPCSHFFQVSGNVTNQPSVPVNLSGPRGSSGLGGEGEPGLNGHKMPHQDDGDKGAIFAHMLSSSSLSHHAPAVLLQHICLL